MQWTNKPNGQNATDRAAEKDSCFGVRLSRYGALSDDEVDFIARMERSERSVVKGETIIRANVPQPELFVLKSGWAAARSAQMGGRSQTLRIYLPGEVMGLAGIGLHHAPHDVQLLTDGIVCPFPRDHMTTIFARSPRLAALFTSIIGADHIALKDRLVVMGAGDARQRMAHFLTDMHSRLLITNPSLGKRFRLPLRQVDIAEVLGLTKVYVNRLLKGFVKEELIEIERPYVRILQPEVLKDISGYENRYADMDESWFPRRSVAGMV